MKNISTNGALKAIDLGHEPILIIKAEWPSGIRWYADKDLVLGDITASGRISQISSISSDKKRNNVGMVSSLSVTLLDDDGLVKEIIDSCSVEYSPVTIYQHFEGLSKTDLSQIFSGKVCGPIEWNEGDRSLSFNIETRTKDADYGFSVDYIPPADPNNIYVSPNPSVPFINPESVNKPFPLCFGSVAHVPALLLQTAPKGALKYPFRGPRDPSQQPTISPYLDDTHFYLQDGDGAYFPQGQQIDVEIDGYIFRGAFGTQTVSGTDTLTGDTFLVAQANLPKYENVLIGPRDLTDIDHILSNVAWLLNPVPIVNNWCFFVDVDGNAQYFRCIRQDGLKVEFDRSITIPASGAYRGLDVGDKILEVAKHGRDGWDITFGFTGSPAIPSGGNFGNASYKQFLQAVDVLSRISWRINAGAQVKLWAPFREDVWVANLIPSTRVVSVWADQTNKEGVRELIPVPTNYYTISQNNITVTNLDGDHTLTPTRVIVNPPLSEYEGQKWGSQVYVSLQSSVGPNTSDVIKWLLQTYTDSPVDDTSFSSVASLIVKYPCGFARFDRGNTTDLCEKIAYCARLGLVVDDGIFRLVYLSKVRASIQTYDESKILVESLRLQFTSTEDIYTRTEAKFKLTYYPAPRFERTFIFQSNVAQYGLRKRDFDCFIYNIPSLVLKSLNFWGARDANSWRLVKGKMPMESLALEIFDPITIAFNDTTLINAAAMVGEVSKYSYNPDASPNASDGELNEVTAWLPSVAGSTSVASFAYLDDSGDITPDDILKKYLPTANDIRLADDESKFRVIAKIIAGSTPIPSIVKSVVPN